MKMPSTSGFLGFYSGVVTALLVAVMSGSLTADEAASTRTFEEITVKRINVIEPDGKVRLIISDKARFPGFIFKGREYAFQRGTAGMLFFNDEGSENGGLIFGGSMQAGQASSFGHLSFDAYMQDQVMTLDSDQRGNAKGVSMLFWDRPSWPITDLLDLLTQIANLPPDQQQTAIERFQNSRPQAKRRMLLARNTDNSVGLQLKDSEGRDRIVIKVAGDGSPVLQFLDQNGNVVSQLPSTR